MPEFLVLRPQPGADATVAALEAAGIPARALPLLRLQALPETPALRACLQALADYTAVVFVSPAAVAFGMAWVDHFWPQYPTGPTWIAVGEATRQALATWGITAVAPPAAAEDSEGMLALPALQQVGEAKVLILRGQGGRELLATTLRQRGARVDIVELYQRRPQQVTLPAVAAVAGLVVSSQAVLDALLGNDGLRFAGRPMVVPSRRVADAAREAGFEQVVEAGGAGPQATVAAIESMGKGEVL